MSLSGFKELKRKVDLALPLFNGFVSALGARQELRECGVFIEDNQFSLYGQTFKFYLNFFQKEDTFTIDMENSAFGRGKGVFFRFAFHSSIFSDDRKKPIDFDKHVGNNQFKSLHKIDFDKFIVSESTDPGVVNFINIFLNELYRVYSCNLLLIN